MTLDKELREIIRCPACGTFAAEDLEAGQPQQLTCTGCGNVYPVRDGVPILLVDEARTAEGDRPAHG